MPLLRPKVTVLLPILNEELYISRCLDALLMQTYPPEALEILVLDGMSDDSTRDIVLAYCQRHPHITLLDNPDQNTIAALNLGIRKASGEILVRVDGHTIVAPDYIEQCVRILEQSSADNVGGPMRPVGESYFQEAVALATSSIFGIGWGKFHYSEKEEYTDTVYLGCYRKSLFDRIGLFDPEMTCSEDNELNWRILNQGGKILLSPVIRSTYYPRGTVGGLARQYWKYGYYKIKCLIKHKNISWRHFVPAVFLGFLALGLALLPFAGTIQYPLWLALGSYALLSCSFSVNLASKKGWRFLPVLPVVFLILHISYGAGFWAGIIKFFLLSG